MIRLLIKTSGFFFFKKFGPSPFRIWHISQKPVAAIPLWYTTLGGGGLYNGTFFFSISSSIPNTFRIYVFAFFAFFHVFWRYSCHLKDTRGFTLSTSCKLSRYKRNDSWGQITRTHASHGLPPARILVPDFKNTSFFAKLLYAHKCGVKRARYKLF